MCGAVPFLTVCMPYLIRGHKSAADVPCVSGELTGELLRGVRVHFTHYVKQLEESGWKDAQRGLAHSYSRAKVKFNVNRVDNMIIQVRACSDSSPPCKAS